MYYKTKITFLLVFAILFCNCISTGQNIKMVPVEEFLKLKTEKERIQFLDSIHYNLEKLENSKALEEWDNLLELCQKLGFATEQGFCHYYKGIILKNSAEYFNSYIAYQESKKIFEAENSLVGLAKVNNSLGILYKELNEYDQSFTHYLESVKLFTLLNNYVRIGYVNLNLGVLWLKQDSIAKAKNYLCRSKDLLEKYENPTVISCYINLGDVYKVEKNADSAYFFYSESYRLSKTIGDAEDRFNTTFHLAEFLFSINRIAEAEPLIKEIELLFENTDVVNLIPLNLRTGYAHLLSEYFEYKEDYLTSLQYLKQATNYELDYKLEQAKLDLQKKHITDLEVERTKEINRRLWTTYISIAVFLGLMLLLFSFYRSYKHKKAANRLLTEMDELKTRLYSNISHELRTPLTLIIGPLEQMLSSETKQAPSRKQVKMMQKNANSLLMLVNQMLDLSKIDAKSMKLELIEDDINKFVKSRFAAFSSLAEQKSITYHYSLLKGKNIRIFDASKLEKIINNLISNAIKFTPRNGKIECLASYPEPDKLEIAINDTGRGIPKEELKLIFDRFHQIKANDEIMNVGTGIGLSLTKELVELLHGQITVNSEISAGTKFTLSIPLGTAHLHENEFVMIQNKDTSIQELPDFYAETGTDSKEEENEQPEKEPQNLPNVLIVEDNSDVREYISENLHHAYNIEQAKNGKAGLKKAVSNIPDLIITDVVMPKKDGIELCKLLKNNEKTSHIPIIMLTGKSGMEDKLKGLNTGVDAYLTKPFNIDELKLRVSNLIEQRRKLRERFTKNLKFEPKEIAVTSMDEKFISKAMEVIENNMGNSEFEVRQLQEEMLMSRMQLFRKIKALTNQTPGEFIRTIRLKRAASLIKQNFGNIAQITYEVGFNNPSYFAKCFKDLFGELPSEYAKTYQIKS